MIVSIPDIDIYILYYLDIKSVTSLGTISKSSNVLISNVQFMKEFYLLNNIYDINKFNIIQYASKHNYIALIKYMDESTNDFIYTIDAIDLATYYGHLPVLE